MLALLAALALAAPAQHATLSIDPDQVRLGESFTLTGKGWPVIEFCERNMRFSMKPANGPRFHIGNATVSKRGKFTFTYKVKKGIVAKGEWKVRANLMCESGEDGSPNPIKVSVPLSVS